jgi:tol-pal system protein YbgF
VIPARASLDPDCFPVFAAEPVNSDLTRSGGIMKKICGIAAMVGALFFFQACTAAKPREDADISKIETRLSEMNNRLDELKHRVSVLQFMVDDHQKTISALGKPTGRPLQNPAPPVEPPPPSGLPQSASPPGAPVKPMPVPAESAETAYNNALSVYKTKDYRKAASMFQSIAANYPGHDLADNALYWTGECYYAVKDYKGAIGAFKRVIKNYPNGSKVPDSLLKIGYAYLALKDPVNAQSFLKKVVKQYPFTPAGTKAGEMLKKIQT